MHLHVEDLGFLAVLDGIHDVDSGIRSLDDSDLDRAILWHLREPEANFSRSLHGGPRFG